MTITGVRMLQPQHMHMMAGMRLLLIQCMMRMLGLTREALDDLVIMHLKLRSRTLLQVHMGSQWNWE
jgi:hypothetical protein